MCTGSSRVCANGKYTSLTAPLGLAIYHFSLKKKRKRLRQVRSDHSSKIIAGILQAYFPFGYFGWKFWTAFDDVPFILKIFQWIKPKLSCRFLSDRNFRKKPCLSIINYFGVWSITGNFPTKLNQVRPLHSGIPRNSNVKKKISTIT